ncbi:MAG TPA: kynureninase, partial [Candidatus Binatia bacterium]|nr:kynureninase [Candidatus Binatia bacterium]
MILTDIHSFSTDLYAAESVADLLNGRRVRRAEASAIGGTIDKDTACVVVTHLDYRSGHMHDMN